MVKKVKVIPATTINKPFAISDESIHLIVDIFTGKRKRALIKRILIRLQHLNSVGEDDGGRVMVCDANGNQLVGTSSLFEILDYLTNESFAQPIPADTKIFLEYGADKAVTKMFNEAKVKKLLNSSDQKGSLKATQKFNFLY